MELLSINNLLFIIAIQFITITLLYGLLCKYQTRYYCLKEEQSKDNCGHNDDENSNICAWEEEALWWRERFDKIVEFMLNGEEKKIVQNYIFALNETALIVDLNKTGFIKARAQFTEGQNEYRLHYKDDDGVEVIRWFRENEIR